LQLFSAWARLLSRPLIVRAAARRLAASRTVDGCRPASTKPCRKLDKDAVQVGARYLPVFRCSWCTQVGMAVSGVACRQDHQVATSPHWRVQQDGREVKCPAAMLVISYFGKIYRRPYPDPPRPPRPPP
jgi:hypothetical protein